MTNEAEIARLWSLFFPGHAYRVSSNNVVNLVPVGLHEDEHISLWRQNDKWMFRLDCGHQSFQYYENEWSSLDGVRA